MTWLLGFFGQGAKDAIKPCKISSRPKEHHKSHVKCVFKVPSKHYLFIKTWFFQCYLTFAKSLVFQSSQGSMPYDRTPKIITIKGRQQIRIALLVFICCPITKCLVIKNCIWHFLQFQPTMTSSLCLVMGVLENFYSEILFIYLVEDVW